MLIVLSIRAIRVAYDFSCRNQSRGFLRAPKLPKGPQTFFLFTVKSRFFPLMLFPTTFLPTSARQKSFKTSIDSNDFNTKKKKDSEKMTPAFRQPSTRCWPRFKIWNEDLEYLLSIVDFTIFQSSRLIWQLQAIRKILMILPCMNFSSERSLVTHGTGKKKNCF